MSGFVRPNNLESLLAALQQCEEKQEYHKKETERLEKEEKLLRAEIRHAKLHPLHDRLARTNAALNACYVEQQKHHPQRNIELEATIWGHMQDRKRALLLGSQEQAGSNSDHSLVNMSDYIWRQLSDEERQQRGYAMAALNGSMFTYDRDDHFGELYPELSDDRAVFLARVENRSHPTIHEFPLVIPAPYWDDQEVILVLLEYSVQPSIDHVSQRLMSSRDFLEEVISVCRKMRYFWAAKVLAVLLNNQLSRRTLSDHPQLVVSLIGHKCNDDHVAVETTLSDGCIAQFLNNIYGEQWHCDALREWVRTNRLSSSARTSLATLRNSFSTCQDKRLVLKAVDETEGHILKYLPPFSKYDFDVLVAAMCWAEDGHSFFMRLYDDELSHLGFDNSLYLFGHRIRSHVGEMVARYDRFETFLNASRNFRTLGLDNDTTTALLKCISDYVGVPSAHEFSRLRTALVVTKGIGY